MTGQRGAVSGQAVINMQGMAMMERDSSPSSRRIGRSEDCLRRCPAPISSPGPKISAARRVLSRRMVEAPTPPAVLSSRRSSVGGRDPAPFAVA